ncbi:MAG: cupin domain-containing protein [Halobacteriales archaeon]|nr:cupin domain-containing protein [Halobacteriales archaeon]
MDRIRIDDCDRYLGPAEVKRPLGRALGAEDMALNYYELAPGDSFAFGYHAHESQEEVFLIQSGTVTFQTDEGPVTVGPEEAIRFAPGEYQRGVNDGDERVIAYAIGAPQDSGALEMRRTCPDCGTETSNRVERAPDTDADELVTVCTECGALTGRFRHGEVPV